MARYFGFGAYVRDKEMNIGLIFHANIRKQFFATAQKV